MVRAVVLFAVMLLTFDIAKRALAEDEHGPDDPLISQRLVEGVATSKLLWVRNSKGAVVEFSRSDGARRELATHGVLDMLRSGNRLLGIREVGQETGVYRIFDLVAQISASPKLTLNDPPFAVVEYGGLTVLTRGALFRLEGNDWRRQNLTKPLRGVPGRSVSFNDDRLIYLGYNFGEWGGGLQVIEPATGRVSEIGEGNGNGSEGLLNKDLDPVTGLARDAMRPECVLASVGLWHLWGGHGRILRICGVEVETLFSEPMPPPPELNVPTRSSTWPFFSLAPTPNGWVAVSFGRMFHSSDGVVSQSEMLPFEFWHGLKLNSAHPDLIILVTDLNLAHSTSGYTPLLVPVSE